MEEILSFIKYLATSNAINFVIMLVLLGWVLQKVNLGKSFDEVIVAIKDGITKSEDDRKKANKTLQDSKVLLDKLSDDIKQIEQNSKEKIEIFKTQIEENTQKTLFEIESNVDKVVLMEESKISNMLIDNTSIAAINLAKQRFVEMLNKNPQMHFDFIQQSLDELERVELS